MRRLLILTTAVLILSPGPSDAENVTRLAHWAEGPSVTVAVDGNIVLLGHGGFLEVLDFVDPASPLWLDRIEMEGFITDILLIKPLAFVSLEERGIHILDVDDPSEIVPRAFLPMEDHLRGMETNGTLLYYATARSGFRIVDVSDPTSPVEIGVLGETNLIESTVAGNHAYLSQSPGVLLIVDISDPAMPYVENVMPPIAGFPQFSHLESADGLLFGLMRNVAGFHSFRTFDLGDPADPQLVGLLTGALDLRHFTVSGDQVRFLSQDEILIFDVSDPWNPVQVAAGPMLDRPIDLAASGELAFVAESDFGLQCFDVGNGVGTALVTEVSRFGEGLHGAYTDVHLQGDLLYASAVAPGLVIFDAADLSEKPIVGSLYDHVPGQPDTSGYSVTVHDGHAYLRCSDAAGSWLRVIDVTDPAAPVEVASVEGTLLNTRFRGPVGYSIRTDGGYRLVAHDFTAPANPQPVVDMPLSGWSTLTVDSDLLLLITGETLSAYGIDDPHQPTWLGEVDLGWGSPQIPVVVAHADGVAYVTTTGAMRVVDYGDPGAMVVHTAPAPADQPWDMACDGGFLCVAEGSTGVEVFSVADPYAPTLAGSYRTGYWAWGVSVSGAQFFVADSHDGVYALRNDLVASHVDQVPGRARTTIGSYPNPFNPRTTIHYDLREPGWVRLRVHDARGRHVRTLIDGLRREGPHSLSWDGRDEEGKLLPSGVYYLRIETHGGRADHKVVLVR